MAKNNAINNQSWSLTTDTFITASSGNITATLGNISATAGSLNAGTTVTAGTGLTVTTGKIEASAGALRTIGDSATGAGSLYCQATGSNANGVSLRAYKDRSGGVITSGDQIYSLTGYGYDGTSYIACASINFNNTGTVGANQVAANIVFRTHPDSTSALASRMTIGAAGNVTINAPDSGTGLTISGGGSSTTGRADFANGISFDAGTNTLSAYTARSTFTPVVAFGGGSVGITYSTQTGLYNLIGKLLHFHISIVLTSKGTSTGSATITGLPIATFTSCNAVYSFRYSNVTFTGIPDMRSTSPSTAIVLEEYTSGGAAAAFNDTNFANNSAIVINGFYFIA